MQTQKDILGFIPNRQPISWQNRKKVQAGAHDLQKQSRRYTVIVRVSQMQRGK